MSDSAENFSRLYASREAYKRLLADTTRRLRQMIAAISAEACADTEALHDELDREREKSASLKRELDKTREHLRLVQQDMSKVCGLYRACAAAVEEFEEGAIKRQKK